MSFAPPPGGFRGGRGGGSRGGGGSSFRGGRGGSRGGGRGGGGGAPGFSEDPMPATVTVPNIRQQAHGDEGQQVALITNFYRFDVNPQVMVYHYDVDVKKDMRHDRDSPDGRNGNGHGNGHHGGNGHNGSNGNGSNGNGSNGNGDGRSSPSEGSTASTDSQPDAVPLKPERFIQKFSPMIVQTLINQNVDLFNGYRWVYDGYKNMYTVQELNFDGKSRITRKVRITVDGRELHFVVRVKLVENSAVSDVADYLHQITPTLSERTLSMYEIMFKFLITQMPGHEEYQRKFYDLSTAENSQKTQYADLVQGFNTSVRLCEFGLALNLHLKTSCVLSKNFQQVLELARLIANIGPQARPKFDQLQLVNKVIKHLTMYTEVNQKKVVYKIDGLIDIYPEEQKFDRDGTLIDVRTFFRQQYNIELQPLPLVRTVGRLPRFVPLELCFFQPNQFLSNQKIGGLIQRELLFKSTHQPNVYFKKCTDIVGKIAASDQDLQQQFGVRLNAQPIQVTGRVLPTPPTRNSNPRDKFFRPERPPMNWAVFCYCERTEMQELNGFVQQLIQRAGYFGIQFPPPSPVVKVPVTEEAVVENTFTNLTKYTSVQFAFFGIPEFCPVMQTSRMYGLIKRFEQETGIMTQCFNTKNVNRIPNGYFDNFLMKTNGKFGGLNAVIDEAVLAHLPFNMANTMMIGLDLNQPSLFDRVSYTVSVAVGSMDQLYSKYNTAIQVQKNDDDQIIKDLDRMIHELLQEYFQANGRHPENLIIFRNGLSEGAFDAVRRVEIPSIERGINMTGKPTKFTLIILQKHHNTRFGLTTPNRASHRPTWNVASGTVVDQGIVDPRFRTFYLNSHFSALGTSRPSKYTIIRDDLNMDSNQLQRMTFFACYNSIRTRQVLAIPTAIRYADLLTYRTRLLVEAVRNSFPLPDEGSENFEQAVVASLNRAIKTNDKLKAQLYYC